MKIADRVSIWKNKPFDKETIKKIIELEKNEDFKNYLGDVLSHIINSKEETNEE